MANGIHLGHHEPPRRQIDLWPGVPCDENAEWIVIGSNGEETCHGGGLGGQAAATVNARQTRGWELPYSQRVVEDPIGSDNFVLAEFVQLPDENTRAGYAYAPLWVRLIRDSRGRIVYPTLQDIYNRANPSGGPWPPSPDEPPPPGPTPGRRRRESGRQWRSQERERRRESERRKRPPKEGGSWHDEYENY